ncbi:MAG: hypothetical protein ABIN54_09060 [candidate division WOR-3 bacterium]
MRPEIAIQNYKHVYNKIKVVKIGKRFVLDPAQALALHACMPGRGGKPYEIVMLNAGQGAGKTFFAPIWMFYKARLYHQKGLDQKRPFSGFIGGPDGPHIEQVLWPRIVEAFGEPGTMNLYPLFGQLKIKNSLTNAAIVLNPDFCVGHIYFRHMKEGLKLQGRHMTALLIDEVDIGSSSSAFRISDEIWSVIKQRTRRFNREVLFTTTPYRQGWVFWDVYRPSKQVKFEVYFRNSVGTIISHETWLKTLSEVYYEARMGRADAIRILEKLKKEWILDWDLTLKSKGTEPYLTIIYPNILSPYYPVEAHLEAYLNAVQTKTLDQFRMLMMGEWVVADVHVFKNFTSEQIVSALPPTDNKVYVGVDFGFGESASALVFLQRTLEEPRRWVVCAEWEGHEQPADLARRLIATVKYEGWEIAEISYDAMGMTQKYRAGQVRPDEVSVGEQFLRTLELEGVGRHLCRGILVNRADSFGHLIRVVNQQRLLVHSGAVRLCTQLGTIEQTDLSGKSRRSHTYHLVDALRIAIYNIEAEEMRKLEMNLRGDYSLPRERYGHRGHRSVQRPWADWRKRLGT